MLMPKKNRIGIYEYLFKEGVMVAKKDYHAPKHTELENIPNLQVIKAMQVTIFRVKCTYESSYSKFTWTCMRVETCWNFMYVNLSVLKIARLCKGAICLEALLLVSHKWRYRISAWIFAPSTRDCTVYLEKTAKVGNYQAKTYCSEDRRLQADGRSCRI